MNRQHTIAMPENEIAALDALAAEQQTYKSKLVIEYIENNYIKVDKRPPAFTERRGKFAKSFTYVVPLHVAKWAEKYDKRIGRVLAPIVREYVATIVEDEHVPD